MRNVLTGVALLMASIGFSTQARAGIIVPAALISSQQDADGVNFDYSIALTNTSASTSTIGTFWFAWVPGKDFMSNSPISIASPSGWKSLVTSSVNNGLNGYAIQWVSNDSSTFINAGDTLTFKFVSAEIPSQFLGNSAAFPTFPEGTSFVYNAAPFSADSAQFVVSAVPEPSTLSLGLIGLVGFGIYRRKR